MNRGTLVKRNLLDMDLAELTAYIKELEVPAYRAKQIQKWMYAGTEIHQMTDLPAALRSRLSAQCSAGLLTPAGHLRSAIDETQKFLFALSDGNVIESVLMKYKYGYSACISSQAGCRMGCTFCASSGAAFSRNLTAGEMLGQIITMNRICGVRIGHAVLMGIGEPLDNYDNVLTFLRRVQDPDCLGISYRKISLSTCGVVPGILRLAKESIPITLSVSLHSPFEAQRSEMMPINRKYPLDKLMDACNSYTLETGRRITFEYAMIAGVNDTQAHCRALVALLKSGHSAQGYHVNLIPVNQVAGRSYERSEKGRIGQFREDLEKAGISATVRRALGRDIEAACGQLRRGLLDTIRK